MARSSCQRARPGPSGARGCVCGTRRGPDSSDNPSTRPRSAGGSGTCGPALAPSPSRSCVSRETPCADRCGISSPASQAGGGHPPPPAAPRSPLACASASPSSRLLLGFARVGLARRAHPQQRERLLQALDPLVVLLVRCCRVSCFEVLELRRPVQRFPRQVEVQLRRL